MESDQKEIQSEVYIKLLNFLSFKLRSEKELFNAITKYLSRYHLPSKEINEIRSDIISRLNEDGYLSDSNDFKYSHSYILGLESSGKSVNRIKISQFLTKKGVEKDVIESVLEDTPKDIYFKSAVKDAEKKLRLTKRLDLDKFQMKRKISDFLYRKGYDYETISSVVDTLF